MYIKTLSKQEGPNVCWNACSLNPLFEFESAACCLQPPYPTKKPTSIRVKCCPSCDFSIGCSCKVNNVIVHKGLDLDPETLLLLILVALIEFMDFFKANLFLNILYNLLR